jgi:hypothetical protein
MKKQNLECKKEESSMEKLLILEKKQVQNENQNLLNQGWIKENLVLKNRRLVVLKKHLNLQIECIKKENKKTEKYFSVFLMFNY